MGNSYSQLNTICNCSSKSDEYSRQSIYNSRRNQEKYLTETYGKRQFFTLSKNNFIEITNPDDPNIYYLNKNLLLYI